MWKYHRIIELPDWKNEKTHKAVAARRDISPKVREKRSRDLSIYYQATLSYIQQTVQVQSCINSRTNRAQSPPLAANKPKNPTNENNDD